MTKRSCRSPDRAPRGRRARPARATSTATPRRPNPSPPPPRCAPSRLPAATGARAARRAGSRRRRSGQKCCCRSSAGRSISTLAMSAQNRIEFVRSRPARRWREAAGWAGAPAPSGRRRLRSRRNRRGRRRSARASAEAPARPLPIRPPPARGPMCAAHRGPCTKPPPAPGARRPKDRRAAPVIASAASARTDAG